MRRTFLLAAAMLAVLPAVLAGAAHAQDRVRVERGMARLKKGKTIRLESDSGTDVWFDMTNRPVIGQWGYTDDEMAAFLELGQVIDVRGWMGRPMAERLLRRLTRPAAPTPGTLAVHRSMSLMEGASENRTAPQSTEGEAAEAS